MIAKLIAASQQYEIKNVCFGGATTASSSKPIDQRRLSIVVCLRGVAFCSRTGAYENLGCGTSN
ncbi:hypothetical protein KIN20_021046 [Parelaphostrongylus tenuis]|uniref:Uncharacterized protein n=1 Tax=Parelaphostrongylus tenuis TaxID=148309 RepID=A0AAD5QVX1_PARTN|nr:hypothetical protein KIN20_021046 [Parelaphostrongylus tenuis]